MRIFLSLLLCFVFLVAASQKKGSNAADRLKGIDTLFNRVLKEWKAAGFAVAVVQKDTIIYAKGFGYRDVEKKLPVTPNTLFAIGSVTKAFTASLIGLLQKDGKVDYDKPALTYLPDLRFYNDALNNSITLRQMMSHQTGLPRHDFSWYLFTTASRDSVLRRIQYQQPTFAPREKWQYNNFMFTAQGAIAEKMMRSTWEEAVNKAIFDPLQMRRSNFSIKELEGADDAAKGYNVKGDTAIHLRNYYNINAMGPAGSINSSVTEMASWLITWINGGKFRGKEVLPSQYISEAMTSQAIVNAGLPSKEKPDVHFSTYGFGWFLQSYRGHYRVDHGGNIDGFSASASFFPTDSIGIVVLSNQDGSRVPSIVRNTIADRLLNLKPYNWHDDLRREVEKAKASQKEVEKTKTKKLIAGKPTHPLKDYEGIYSHPGYGNFEVVAKGDSLFAKASDYTLWLRHSNYDVFEPFIVDPHEGIDTSDNTDSPMQFQLNTTGEVSTLMAAFQAGLDPLPFKKQPKTIALAKSDLKKYEGEYELGGIIAKVFTKNETLYLFVPGQPEYELAATDKDKFVLKALQGYTLQFVANDKGEITEATFQQPNGNFTAKRKKG